MAKKKETQKKQTQHTQTHHTSRWRFTDLVAFIALAAAAILLLVGPITRWILNQSPGAMTAMSAISMVAQFCLLFALAIPAWYYVRGKRKGWKIFYIIVLVIYVAATICGLAVGI